jgi:penicillin-binding protein 1A
MLQITKFTRISLWLLLTGISGTMLLFSSAYLYLSPQLPPVDVLKDVQLQTPSRIYSADGQLLGEFGEKRRNPISFEQIPTAFVQAIISAEDDRFFSHHGVDLAGLLRAVAQLVLTGEKQSGGSTITMQVARNYFLSFERTFSRKFNEILLALQIERELPKEEILELYLNKIFLGNRAYGIEAAAQVYYGKPIAELNLAQLAMIAGLPKAPSTFNPIINPERALVRRNWILGRMHELDYIDDTQLQEAISHPITASYHGSQLGVNAPYVAEMARKELYDQYQNDAYTAGFRVYTTVNSKLQAAAQKALSDGLMAYDKRHGYRGPEQQLLAQDPKDNRELWRSTLATTPAYGGLIPAVVTAIEPQSIQVLLASGEEIQLGWQDGLADSRPYINVNNRGPAPKKAEDIVTVGDLIRLRPKAGGGWELSQLPATQAALVSLNAEDGAIISLVGGFDYEHSKFNRVTQAARQPGSNFKPFIYTAALENGFTPATIINDAPIVFEDQQLESSWRPENSSGKFYGPTRMRQALYLSRNLVSIRILRSVGISTAINYIGRFGFDPRQLPKDLSLALGSHSIRPLEVVTAYAVLANGGFKVDPYLIDRIEALDGTVLYQANPAIACADCENTIDPATEPTAQQGSEAELTMEEIIQQQAPAQDEHEAIVAPPEPILAERVVDKRTAYIIDDMLRDVVKRGTGRKARSLGRSDLAGKTGTTNGPADAWFSGYGGGIVTTTWLGFDKNELLGRREYGGSAALPVWIEYMRVALQGVPEVTRKRPEGIVSVKIDPETGLLARPGQQNAIFEIFREELAPREEASDSSQGSDPYESGPIPEEDIF